MQSSRVTYAASDTLYLVLFPSGPAHQTLAEMITRAPAHCLDWTHLTRASLLVSSCVFCVLLSPLFTAFLHSNCYHRLIFHLQAAHCQSHQTCLQQPCLLASDVPSELASASPRLSMHVVVLRTVHLRLAICGLCIHSVQTTCVSD